MRRTRAAVAEDRIDDGVSRDELAVELVVGHVIDRDAAVDRHLKERRELMSTRLARAIHRARQDHPNRCAAIDEDRKSTRLNSSHDQISYAVFCLKKKKKK